MATPNRRFQQSPTPKRRNTGISAFSGVAAEATNNQSKTLKKQNTRKLSLPPIGESPKYTSGNRYVTSVAKHLHKQLSQEILPQTMNNSQANLDTIASSGAHLKGPSRKMSKDEGSMLSPKGSKGKSPRNRPLKSLVSSVQTIKTTVINPSVMKLSKESRTTKRNESKMINQLTQSRASKKPSSTRAGSGMEKFRDHPLLAELLEQNPEIRHFSEYEMNQYLAKAEDFKKLHNRSFVISCDTDEKHKMLSDGYLGQYYTDKVGKTVRPLGGPKTEEELIRTKPKPKKKKVAGGSEIEVDYVDLRTKTSLIVAQQQLKEIQNATAAATQEQFEATNRLNMSDIIKSPRILQPGFVPATTFMNSPQKGMSYETIMQQGQTIRPFMGASPGQTSMPRISQDELINRIVFEQEGSLLPMLNQSCMDSLHQAHQAKLNEYSQMSPRARRKAIASGMITKQTIGAKAYQLPEGAVTSFTSQVEDTSTKVDSNTFMKTDLINQPIHEETLSELDSHGLFSDSSQKGFMDDTIKSGIPVGTKTKHGFKDYDDNKKVIRVTVLKEFKEDERIKAQKEQEEQNPDLLKRRKRPKLQKRKSFSECGMKFEDGLGLREKYNFSRKGPNMINGYTIDEMRKADKFPIMEPLLCRPEKYDFHIDTLMHAAYHRGNVAEWAEWIDELPAPNCSSEENEFVDIYFSTDSDKPEVELNKKPDPMARFAALNKAIFRLSNFKRDVMVDFPDKVRENETPTVVLVDRDPANFQAIHLEVAKTLFDIDSAENFDRFKKAYWDMEYTQLLFEYFCLQFKAAAPDINRFLTRKDSGWWTLAFKNYTLNEPTLKALASLIPFLVMVDEINLTNNGMQDMVGSCVVFAVFLNPSVRNFIVQGNFTKNAFMDTLKVCAVAQPQKLVNINFLGSINFPSTLEKCIKTLNFNKHLTDLNLAGNNFGLKACGMMSSFMIYHGYNLNRVNLSRCNTANQGTRYIIDALNRNTSIKDFNFGFNDMSSSVYEFSIKIGAIMTRHPNLMHLDITATSLKREEVLFIGLALTMSKTMLSLHLTGNALPYYDRIFMRSLMAARVGYNFKNDGQHPKIKNNKEFTQIMSLASGNNYGDNVRDYVKAFNDLEEEREGLDFQIQDIINEIDAEKEYKDLPSNFSLEDVGTQSKLGQLIVMMKERQTVLIRSKAMAKKAVKQKQYGEQMDEVKSIQELANKAEGKTENPTQFWQELGENINKEVAKTTYKPGEEESKDKEKEEPKDDAFDMQQKLGVERQRQKAERDLIKEEKNRSQGELALMFMGINQIANQLLNENPMTGYMAQIIFTRVLGEDTLEQAHYWTDCNQCWICAAWNKFEVHYHPDNDKKLFTKQVDQMQMVSANVARIVQNSLEDDGIYDELIDDMDEELMEIAEASEEVSSQKSEVVDNLPNLKDLGAAISDGDVDGRTAGAATPEASPRARAYSIDKTQRAELEVDPDQKNALLTEKMRELGVNTQNPVAVTTITRKELKQKQYPENYGKKTVFNKMDLSHEVEDPLTKRQKVHNKVITHNLAGPPANSLFPGLVGIGGKKKPASSAKSERGFEMDSDYDIKEINAEIEAEEKGNGSTSDALTVNTSAVKVRRRVRGQPTLIEREVFFKGMVFLVEEVIYSDSDKSSIYTSEDEFESSKTIGKDFADRFPLLKHRVQNLKQQEVASPTGLKTETKAKDKKRPENASPAGSGDEKSDTETSKKKKPHQWADDKEENMRREIDRKEAEVQRKIRIRKGRKQEEYQNKMLPKQYIESLKDQRIQKFEKYEIGEAERLLKKRKKRQRKRLERKVAEAHQKEDPELIKKFEDQLAALENEVQDDQAEKEDVFLISSAYDWLPMKMKTKRRLTLEKISMLDGAPPSILNIDNTTLVYANYVAPGFHYFYFVTGKERVFLNPSYPICRFKNTNVFLNRVNVKPKVHEFQSVFTLKEGMDDEELFLIDCSVFAKYEVEQVPQRHTLMKRCFEQDWKYAKFDRVCKSDEAVMKEVKICLYNHFPRLYNIWLYEIRCDEVPTISWGEFTYWSKQMNIIDNIHVDQASFDRTFISTNVNTTTNGLVNSAQRDLNRYEFLEVLARFALLKFRDSKDPICKTATEAIDKLLNENIYPNAETLDGWNFRQKYLYNVPVNEFLRKNLSVIEKIWKTKGIIDFHSKKKFITIVECRLYVNACGISGGANGISERQVGASFYESIRVLENTIEHPGDPNHGSRIQQMQPWEFLVFICSVTQAYFNKTVYKNEEMNIKLEKLLPLWLAPVYQKVEYTTDAKFEYDIKQEKKRLRAARKAAGISDEEDDDDDDSDDDDDDDEPEPVAQPQSPLPQLNIEEVSEERSEPEVEEQKVEETPVLQSDEESAGSAADEIDSSDSCTPGAAEERKAEQDMIMPEYDG